MKKVIFTLALVIGFGAMASDGGDIGSMDMDSNVEGKVIDLRVKPKITKEERLELAKSGQVFVVRGGYAEDLIFGTPMNKAKADARALAADICTQVGASKLVIGKYSNKRSGRQSGGGTMFAEVDLSARCLFN